MLSVRIILNSSYIEQVLPPTWKQANVTPLPKDRPLIDGSKHLRPISLTATMSKMAEDFLCAGTLARLPTNLVPYLNPLQLKL